jgi:hypothetical protein
MYIDKLIGFFGEEGPESARKEINREKLESQFERYKEECEGTAGKSGMMWVACMTCENACTGILEVVCLPLARQRARAPTPTPNVHVHVRLSPSRCCSIDLNLQYLSSFVYLSLEDSPT